MIPTRPTCTRSTPSRRRRRSSGAAACRWSSARTTSAASSRPSCGPSARRGTATPPPSSSGCARRSRALRACSRTNASSRTLVPRWSRRSGRSSRATGVSWRRSMTPSDDLPRATRVAVIADVHGNATAFAAVLAEVEELEPELVVHCGDLTWGPQPQETLALVRGLGNRFLAVRGNGDRMLATFDATAEPTPRDLWMQSAHRPEDVAFVARFPATLEVEIAGLGRTLFCHGSPRSDEELLTPETPESRLTEALAGVDAAVVVSGHSHVSYRREVLGRTLLNPGSVGLPYEGRSGGAYWAVLGPEVEHRRTVYDFDAAVARQLESGDPKTDEILALMQSPPTRDEMIAYCEQLAFSG